MAAENLPVQVACRVLRVAESGYYDHRKTTPSERSVRHALLTDLITQIHVESHQIYGGRRIHAELTLGRGVVVGHHQVELLMRRAGLKGLSGRRKWKRIRTDDIASDRDERQFARTGPDPQQARTGHAARCRCRPRRKRPTARGQPPNELGESADTVFDCVATQGTFDQAVELASRAGTVAVVGVPSRPLTIQLPADRDQQIRVQGCATYVSSDIDKAIGLLGSGLLEVDDFITASVALEEASTAFDVSATNDQLKVLIYTRE